MADNTDELVASVKAMTQQVGELTNILRQRIANRFFKRNNLLLYPSQPTPAQVPDGAGGILLSSEGNDLTYVTVTVDGIEYNFPSAVNVLRFVPLSGANTSVSFQLIATGTPNPFPLTWISMSPDYAGIFAAAFPN